MLDREQGGQAVCCYHLRDEPSMRLLVVHPVPRTIQLALCLVVLELLSFSNEIHALNDETLVGVKSSHSSHTQRHNLPEAPFQAEFQS